jgi:hypothetical protein
VKRPAFQFYPSDWLRDPALRSCSLPARGLWTDLLCYMHEGSPYGHLALNNEPITDAQAARMVGTTVATYRKLLQELEASGVSSRDANGVLYSRRMVRDEHVRSVRAAGGHLGGNPKLMEGRKDKGKVPDKVNHRANLRPTPSSSSSVKALEDRSQQGVDLVHPDLAPPSAHDIAARQSVLEAAARDRARAGGASVAVGDHA